MAQSKDHVLGQGELAKLQNQIHRIIPILKMDGEIKAEDIDDTVNDKGGIMRLLEMHGAVRIIRKEKIGCHTSRRNVYKWNQDVKQELKEYLNDMDKLPCGHRSHIIHHPSEDCFSCKHCDDWPEYDRETIEQCL